ncbi:hypothetical protein ACFX15_028803 [Malus domestica]
MSDGLCEQNASSYNFIAAISGFNDEFMHFSKELANHLGLPSIILITSSAENMLTCQAIPRLLKHGYIPIQDSMMLELVPGLQPPRFKDLPISNFKDLDDLLQLIAKAHNSRSSCAVIWNSMDYLEQPSMAQHEQEYQILVSDMPQPRYPQILG